MTHSLVPPADAYATVAYRASTGAALWVKRYNGPANLADQAHAVAVSPTGTTVYVTGASDTVPGSTDNDYATVAYAASTGAPVWVQRYNGPGNSDDEATTLAVNHTTGTVYVSGESARNAFSGGLDYATIAYRPSGVESSVARYDGPGHGNDQGTAVAVSPTTGTVFVTGGSYGGTSKAQDYATVAYTG